VEDLLGFDVSHRSFAFYGLCKDCAAARTH
jgi:Fe2+ or Zn2+ uptake regulation protein